MQTGAVSHVTQMCHLSKDLSQLPPVGTVVPTIAAGGRPLYTAPSHRYPRCRLRIALVADDLLSSLWRFLEGTINLHIISVLEMETYSEKSRSYNFSSYGSLQFLSLKHNWFLMLYFFLLFGFFSVCIPFNQVKRFSHSLNLKRKENKLYFFFSLILSFKEIILSSQLLVQTAVHFYMTKKTFDFLNCNFKNGKRKQSFK